MGALTFRVAAGYSAFVGLMALQPAGHAAPLWTASAAEVRAEATSPASTTSVAAAFESRLKHQALAQEAEQRWAEAAVSWEILLTLRPDDASYRARLADARRLIEQKAPAQLAIGMQALKRGALEDAEQQFLSALALQPDSVTIANWLRELERTRMRARVLGRPAGQLQSDPAKRAIRPDAPARPAINRANCSDQAITDKPSGSTLPNLATSSEPTEEACRPSP